MKKKDLAIIVLVSGIAAILSYFISSKLFVSSQDKTQQVKKIEVISTEFKTPNNKYFNENSVNPTQTITIGNQPPAPTN